MGWESSCRCFAKSGPIHTLQLLCNDDEYSLKVRSLVLNHSVVGKAGI